MAVRLGALLKSRLLRGALNLDPDEAGQRGVGELFGRVLEADRVEAFALSGGFVGLVALIELGFAVAVVSLGAAGGLQTALLLGWLGLSGGLCWHYVRWRRTWSDRRLGLTQDLVEAMVGHRTRLGQAPRDTWHVREDQALADYLGPSRTMDRMMTWVTGIVPRGWLVVGVAGLIPAFMAGSASAGAMAVSLGGMLMAYRALDRMAFSLVHLADAGIAWRHISPLFRAAARREPAGAVAIGMPEITSPKGSTFRLETGDRVLLQGPSGGGKSTLASVVSGLRPASSGLLLLGGFDGATLGSRAWRQRVVAAPQFHGNHVVSGTFAFNLLMGRRWPPKAEDVEEAEAVCRELGLGSLIDRMPGDSSRWSRRQDGSYRTVSRAGYLWLEPCCSGLSW